MSYKDLQGFQTVAFKSEREGALNDLIRHQPLISAVAEDNSTFLFKISQIINSKLYFTTLEESRPLQAGEQLRLIFSLTTGQYALVAVVEQASTAGSAVIDYASSELLRLQRRDSFRIVVPASLTLDFYLNSKIKPEYAIKVSDVSLGGAALRMPLDQVSSYWVGSTIKGSLVLTGRDPIELEGIVRHYFPKETGAKFQRAGVQFTTLSIDQQREMLSLALQLHREIHPKL